jgi:hypothetical protein
VKDLSKARLRNKIDLQEVTDRMGLDSAIEAIADFIEDDAALAEAAKIDPVDMRSMAEDLRSLVDKYDHIRILL